MDIAADVSLITGNYNMMKFNQEAVNTDMGIPLQIVSEYFNKADNRIDDYIRQCIKYLASMNCVIYNETHMIGTMPERVDVEGTEIYVKKGEVRIATKEEMKLYSELDEIASRKAGIRTNSEKWYGKRRRGTILNYLHYCKSMEFGSYVEHSNCGKSIRQGVKKR